MIFKRRKVKYHVVECVTDDVEIKQPLRKHLSVNYKWKYRLRKIKASFINEKVKSEEVSFSEISNLSSKIINNLNHIYIEQNKCKNLEQIESKINLEEAEMKCSNINNALDDLKPVNWKLQKLEKDFLLKYLETTLLKYNKHSCKHLWKPIRHKMSMSSDIQSKRPYNEYLTSNKIKQKSSVQRNTFKNNFTQTDENVDDTLPSMENYKKWLESSFFLAKAMESAIKDKNVKPILALDSNEMRKFQNIIYNLYGIGPSKKDVIIKPQQKLKSGKKIVTKETKRAPEKTQIKKDPKEDHVIPTITDVLVGEQANEKLIEVKESLLRISENYSETSNFFQPPIVENVFDEFVVYKSAFQSDVKTPKVNEKKKEPIKENYESESDIKDKNKDIYELINKCIEASDDNIKEVFENKKLLHFTLILINEGLQRSLYTIPFNLELSLAFSHSLSSMQSDARLVKSTIMNLEIDEIINEIEKLCHFINTTAGEADIIGQIIENTQSFINETTIVVNPFILKIVEDYSILKEFVLLIQHLMKTYEKVLIIQYFKDCLESTSISDLTKMENYTKETLKEILNDFELLANTLAVIQIWKKRNQEIRKNAGEDVSENPESSCKMSNDYSFAITYNSDDVRTDMEKVKQWISDLSIDMIEQNNLITIFKEFSSCSRTKNIDKLQFIFYNPDLLSDLVANIPLSPEICIKASELCRLFERKASRKNSLILQNESDVDIINKLLANPVLIRQFMSIVNFINLENEDTVRDESVPESVAEFIIYKDEVLIKQNLQESKAAILIKLYKLSNWLSRLDTHCIFSNVPQYNAMNELVVSSIISVINNVDLHPVLKKICNDSKLLSEAIRAVRIYISSETVIRDVNPNRQKSVLPQSQPNEEIKKIEKVEYPVTEPVTEYPDQSKCTGKNHRYSNSEAHKSSVHENFNQESTSQNVTSINNPANNIEDLPGAIIEVESLSCDDLKALQIDLKKTTKDSLLNVKSDVFEKSTKEPGLSIQHSKTEQSILVVHASNKSEDTRKSLNIDETNKFLQYAHSKGSSLALIKRLPSIDETDSNLGIIQTELEDPNILIENKSDYIENIPYDEFTYDNTRSGKDVEGFECENFSVKESSHTNSMSSDKLSFNSQMNALVIKLDHTITSIEIQCKSIKDLEIEEKSKDESYISEKKELNMDLSKKPEIPFIDTNQITQINQPIVLKETLKVKISTNSQLVIDLNNNPLSQDETLNAEVDFAKFSQTTSMDANISLEHVIPVDKSLVIDLNDCIDFKETLTLKESSYLNHTPIEQNEMEIFEIVKEKKVNGIVSDVEHSLDSTDKNYSDIKNVQGEVKMNVHVLSNHIQEPVKITKANLIDDLERGPNVSFKTQIRNLAMELDKSVSIIESISQKMRDLGRTDHHDINEVNSKYISDQNENKQTNVVAFEPKDLKSDSAHSENSHKSQLEYSKINAPINELNEMENFRIVEETRMSFNSHLNSLASKLDITMASIDHKYHDLKDIQSTLSVHSHSYEIHSQAIVVETHVHNDSEGMQNLSYRSQLIKITSRVDETIMLIEGVHQELYPANPMEKLNYNGMLLLKNESENKSFKEKSNSDKSLLTITNSEKNENDEHLQSDILNETDSDKSKLDEHINEEENVSPSLSCNDFMVDNSTINKYGKEKEEDVNSENIKTVQFQICEDSITELVSHSTEAIVGTDSNKVELDIEMGAKQDIDSSTLTCKEFILDKSTNTKSCKENVLNKNFNKDDIKTEIIKSVEFQSCKSNTPASLSRSTQTDSSSKNKKHHTKKIANETGNEVLETEFSPDETISTLGFMVYYLLTILAGRQSQDLFN